MQIVSALFVENFAMRQAPGPSTRIDLTGAMFSMAAPEAPPVTLSPHLVALIYCPADEAGSGVFEVIFRKGMSRGRRADRPQRQPASPSIPASSPTVWSKASWSSPSYGQIFAHCRIDKGPWHLVPFTLLPPVA